MKKNKTVVIILNVLLSLLWLSPLYWAFATSIKTDEEIYGGITLIPENPTFENYINLFDYKNGIFYTYLFNSIMLVAVTILVVTVISVLAGFAFSKLELFGKKIWFSMILFTIMVPATALIVPLHNTMANLGLLGRISCIIIIYVTFQTPFCVYMMKTAFDMIPNSLREAAMIDGAKSVDVFKAIYLPLALPSAITVIVYSAYTTWNDYIIALTFGGNTLKTFNVGIVDLLSTNSSIEWDLLSAGAIVSVIPIVALFFMLQKYFIKGMMSGAVK